MLARLDPQSEKERAAIEAAGIDLNQVLDADTLVHGDDVLFSRYGHFRRHLSRRSEVFRAGSRHSLHDNPEQDRHQAISGILPQLEQADADQLHQV